MSQADKEKWDARYRDGAYATRNYPSPFLVQALKMIGTPPSNARALDLACGAGRNALYLASQGYCVDAVDISGAALQRGARAAQDRAAIEQLSSDNTTGEGDTGEVRAGSVNWIEHDLDLPLGPALSGYGLIIIMRYLDLDLLRTASARLLPGGYLICEVHLQCDEAVTGPSGMRVRAAPVALKAAADGLEIIEYFEGIIDDPDGSRAAVARLLGRM